MRSGLAGAWMQRGGGMPDAMPDAMQRAGAQIYGMAQIQARLLAYVDVAIWIMVPQALTAILIPLRNAGRPQSGLPCPQSHDSRTSPS
jgi:DHA2 family multidrug resistance protein